MDDTSKIEDVEKVWKDLEGPKLTGPMDAGNEENGAAGDDGVRDEEAEKKDEQEETGDEDREKSVEEKQQERDAEEEDKQEEEDLATEDGDEKNADVGNKIQESEAETAVKDGEDEEEKEAKNKTADTESACEAFVKDGGDEKKIVEDQDRASNSRGKADMEDGHDGKAKDTTASPTPSAGASAEEISMSGGGTENANDIDLSQDEILQELPQQLFEPNSDLEYEWDPVKDRRKRVPSEIDSALDIRFKNKTKSAPEHGLHIIENSEKSIYENVTFINCKFQPAGITSFLNCEMRHVTFEDCRFKNTNRFDGTKATDTEFHRVRFDGHFEDKTYDNEVVLDDPRFRRPLAPKQPPRPVWDDRDPRWDEFFHYNSKQQRVRQPAGMEIVDGEHEFYHLVTFLACTFDAKNPTVFKNCALRNVTFKNCHFSGSRFENYYAVDLTVDDCVFEKSQFINVERDDGDELKGKRFRGETVKKHYVPEPLTQKILEGDLELEARIHQEFAQKKMEEQENGNQGESSTEKEIMEETEEQAVVNGGGQGQEQEQKADDGEVEWDVATMGKGKDRAAGSDGESN
ncbi:hypothetical protein PRZ48_002925 [Zasmidium cellare]|uniref:Pentapeptide repeat-containing protein n=1 Tax=Zasmidium cellare TaxID=395010 RepID=A0ABR0ETL7_ZASCE|nr:hypothetical protein PRZ48_002925 [Zasmidium cellare]